MFFFEILNKHARDPRTHYNNDRFYFTKVQRVIGAERKRKNTSLFIIMMNFPHTHFHWLLLQRQVEANLLPK